MSGDVRVTLDVAGIDRLTRAAVTRGVRAATALAQSILQTDILNRDGTGRAYPRGKKRIHRASAPGQPPAPDTGNLKAKTAADAVVTEERNTATGQAEIIGRVVVNTRYAYALEVGTERVAARPFMRRLNDHASALNAAFVAGAKGAGE